MKGIQRGPPWRETEDDSGIAVRKSEELRDCMSNFQAFQLCGRDLPVCAHGSIEEILRSDIVIEIYLELAVWGDGGGRRRQQRR